MWWTGSKRFTNHKLKPIKKYEDFEASLDRRKQAHRLRHLREISGVSGADVYIDGHHLINFCSNDYLGLSRHPRVMARAAEYLDIWGAGATASRLICGNYGIFSRLEKKIAALKQAEAALIFNSGFQANISILPALSDNNTLILSDRLNHNSLIQGCRLSGARVVIYEHNDLGHLARLLEEYGAGGFFRIIIVTESVFSMDGDICDLNGLEELAGRFGAFLMVDDAHATGVLGKNGMGLTAGRKVDLAMGTFGKACGSFGAYVTCSEMLRQYLINRCSGFIYTTGLPPPVLGAVDAALDLIPDMEDQRKALMRNAADLRAVLNKMDFETGHSATQIIPVIVGGETWALFLSAFLEEQGMLVTAIRPPSVPKGKSRVRVSLSALHTQDHIHRLIEALREWRLREDGLSVLS